MTCAEEMTNSIREKCRGRRLVVWGTGKDAVKTTCALREQGLEVVMYTTGSGSICVNSFMGKEILPAAECLECKDIFYVVAVRDVFWQEVKGRLMAAGLKEFEDFVFWKMLDRSHKMVMLHGNCHLDVVENYLLSSSEFASKYWIYPYKRVCDMGDIRRFEKAISLTDVWVYQPIRPENSICYEVSDEYTHPLLKKDVVKISVPNYYHMGKILFPQTAINNPHNPPLSEGRDGNGMFPRSDKVIDRWVADHPDGLEFDELVEYCLSDDAIDESEIKENSRFLSEKILEKDRDCDVKVSQYILDNLAKEQMFYDLGHPTNAVLKKIAQGVLSALGVEDTKEISCTDRLCYHEDPIYPCVMKALGLKWEQRWIRDTEISKKIKSRMDFKEYVREYLFWCYGIGQC